MSSAENPDIESVDAWQDADLGPVKAWIQFPGFRDSKFFAECLNRLVTGRDINVIVTASSETGVGKTTLAVALAMLLDQHGWTAEKAAVANAEEYDRLYDEVGPGSALILDEAEKAMDSRRGMSSSSVELSQTFATKRYRQVFSILTAPSKSWIDNRLGSDAADYWIQAQETERGRIKGEAICYRLRTNEHYEQEYVDRTETITWPNLDGLPEFERLDERKVALLEHDGDGSKYVTQSEMEDRVEEAEDNARTEERNKIIRCLDDEVDALSQEDIGNLSAIDLSSSRVGQIANGDT
ncbi:hypothetical protein [Halobacterium sp. CBA1126]|uniref:hypothetical protein n=1 Tax=Halobacterium sp. CBA1126 TaxID=2668074 RepID=UPI0012F8D135|nr:hypothetical protein [Halobacterium sp. CBA1126]MUV59777.1 hypothetical protein [Halobacterium sp. CBA1126]